MNVRITNNKGVRALYSNGLTKAAAIELTKLIPHIGDVDYFVKNVGVDFESTVLNNLIMIEGCSLKISAESGLKQNNQTGLEEFCKFIKEEAVVWH